MVKSNRTWKNHEIVSTLFSTDTNFVIISTYINVLPLYKPDSENETAEKVWLWHNSLWNTFKMPFLLLYFSILLVFDFFFLPFSFHMWVCGGKDNIRTFNSNPNTSICASVSYLPLNLFFHFVFHCNHRQPLAFKT